MSDDKIEQEIQAKGLTASRITPAGIETVIVSEHYFTADQGSLGAFVDPMLRTSDVTSLADVPATFGQSLELLTFCVLVLRNGFTVTGESACASPENFDAEIGRKVARQNAVQKIWPLEGYLLKQMLHQAQHNAP